MTAPAPPVTTASFSPSGVNGVYPGPVTITLSATAASGFSVTKTTYKVDGGAEQTYSAPFTISSEGDHTLVVQSTDNAGVFEAPKTINVKIQANRAPTANAGGPYRVTAGGTVTLNGSGSDPDSDVLTYNWDLDNNGSFETAGQTPSFSAAGLSAGTSRTAVLEVCDPKDACATAQATVNVVGALAITTDTLSNGTVGVAYSATLQASGGTTPYTWSIPAGTLPAGLTLDAASGVISGTPSAAGISSLNVSVNDGGSQTASKALSLTIHLASNPVPTVNSLSPSSTPAGGRPSP